jgi:hypothetical protein
MKDLLTVPEEDRCLVISEEDRTIELPAELRIIEVTEMPLINSKQHTAGDTKRWTVQYDRWLANTATIEQIDVASSSASFSVGGEQVLGTDIVFFLSGGAVNERTTLTLTMTDSLGNIKHDTVIFTGVAA